MDIEEAFWSSFKDVAAKEKVSLNRLAARIGRDRQNANLSPAIRLHVSAYYMRLGALIYKFYLNQAVAYRSRVEPTCAGGLGLAPRKLELRRAGMRACRQPLGV